LSTCKSKLDQRTRERDAALGQQAATAEVLKAISSSAGELEPVFNAILENATRICEAQIAEIILAENNAVRVAAGYGDAQRLPVSEMVPLDRSTVMGRSICDKKTIHLDDLQNASDEFASGREFAKKFGHRTILCVPLIREGRALGTILVRRMEVRPFEQKHIALLKTFADQAAIAIENARLFNETKEALERQTATSEVLQVISKSPGELESVFEVMLENAVRICGANFGNLWLREGDGFRIGATRGAPTAYDDFLRRAGLVKPDPTVGLGTLIRTKQPFQTEDVTALPTHGDKQRQALIDLTGARTLIGVPMLKANEVIGAIGIYRQEVRPFTDKQIELVKNFAAQAVIAIENARLLTELRESLQQQTATADVLKVISSSPGELEPGFEAMLANATRICEATFGNLLLFEDNAFRAVAVHSKESFDDLRRKPVIDLRDNPGIPLDRVANSKQLVHVLDLRTDQSYIGKNDRIVSLVEIAGARTLLDVPMLKENELVGVIVLYRQEVRPFTDKQIELVKNFAAQAVIAIENTRLLNELRQRTDDLTESLEQQAATSEVLQVISSSPGELEPVFNAMLANATRICEATFGNLFLREGPIFRAVATHSKQGYTDYVRRNPVVDLRDNPGVLLDRLVNTK
jgi:GAF domain-containing protein